MANLKGFTAPAVGNMINHFTRHDGDADQERYKYNNIKIDPAKTYLNYALFETRDPIGMIDEKIARVDTKPGKKTNVMSSWVVTLPKGDKLKGREREFFEVVYDHLNEIVGHENVIGAWVHMDETQPHMHFAFTPCIETVVTTNDKTKPLLWTKADEKKDPSHKAGEIKRDKKGTKRYERVAVIGEDGKPVTKTTFSQAKMFDRRAMKKFHPDLSKSLADHFGFDVGVELDDPGEKALSRLNQEDYSAAKRTKQRLKSETDKMVGELDDLNRKKNDLINQIEDESKRLECLRRERDAIAGRVGILESVSSKCHAVDAAEIGKKGSIFDSISDHCAQIVGKLIRSIPDDAKRLIADFMKAAAISLPGIRLVHDRAESYESFSTNTGVKSDCDHQVQKEKTIRKAHSLPKI